MIDNLDKYLAKDDISVKEAMRLMDKNSKKIVFIVGKENQLLGSVSDGDIRRWILNNGDLNCSVASIMNRTPTSFKQNYDLSAVKDKMFEGEIESIPVVDEQQCIKDILFWDVVFDGSHKRAVAKKAISVVIMTGGKGTRLSPFTKIFPKALVPIGEKAIIEIIMDKFAKYGFREFDLILNYKGEMIKSFLDNIDTGYIFTYYWEKDPLGTVGGVKLINKILSDDFFVSNCDIMIDAHYDDLLNFHQKDKNDITLVGSVQNYKVPYGVMKVSNGGKLEELVEKPEFDFLVNTGLYVINKRVIDLIPEGKLFHITDLISKVKEEKGQIGVYPVSEGAWVDIGQWGEYQKVLKNISCD
ncbi:MAG: sugar phosphate nucleotidyltransferase [Candidatus Margulisiibacteriota bacterium]